MLERKAKGNSCEQKLANTTEHMDFAKLSIPLGRFLPLRASLAVVLHHKKQLLG